ncbi:MAG: sigma 54-interacting transcriptional regulator, partial [Desulfuromonadales bacterium]|nr:sigma 54-interacting transcriptional regulator [Desulfuromonadales bacterium]
MPFDYPTDSPSFFQTVINSIADGIYTVDLEMRITGFSRSAEKMTGHREADVLGRHCREVFRTSVCDTDCPLKWTLKHQKPVQNCTATLVCKEGERIPAFLSSDLLRDGEGRVSGCIGIIRDRREIEALKAKLQGEYCFSDFVGKSKAMTGIFDRIRAVAGTDVTVLIDGESGTGKEILARAIHYRSSRKAGPFVKVNCASLAESLLESELFGHERGAFTGAVAARQGRFREAGGGTLFLDEIGDMPVDLQAKLLRVLQSSEVTPVGGSQSCLIDVRIIAATHRDLEIAVKEAGFKDKKAVSRAIVIARDKFEKEGIMPKENTTKKKTRKAKKSDEISQLRTDIAGLRKQMKALDCSLRKEQSSKLLSAIAAKMLRLTILLG